MNSNCCNVYAKEKCRELLCKSSTAAAAAQPIPIISTETLHDAYDLGCELQKKRVECAIMLKAALAAEEED